MASGATDLWARVRDWARIVKRDTVALWIAARDPRTPLLAKVLAAAIAAYALSPIDLIPDFIPVLGYLDDVLLIPLGILLVVRLIPPTLMEEFRLAAAVRADRPPSVSAVAIVLATWLALGGMLVWWLWPRYAGIG